MTGEWVGLFFLIKACSGADHLTFEARVRVISEKNSLETDFEGKQNLARKNLAYSGFVCQGKKILAKPNNP